MSVGSSADAFVDTNVWLYAFLTGDPKKHGIAAALLRGTTPVVSAQVVNEVCANLIRKGGFDGVQIRRTIREFYSYYRVVPLDRDLFLDAADLRDLFSLSYWDSLIVAVADRAGVSTLYTEDLQDGLVIRGRLRVENPFRP